MGEGCGQGGGVLLVFFGFHTAFLTSFKQLLLFSEWDFLFFSFTFFYRGTRVFFFFFFFSSLPLFLKCSTKLGIPILFFPYSKEDIWREEEVSCLYLSTDEAMHDAR